MKISSLLLAFFLGVVSVSWAQEDFGVYRMSEFRNPKSRMIIRVPEVDGFQVLKCDFHTHTVFSDGHVWPLVRVQEAWQEGLDVLAITDHVEYTPHEEDVKVDHNRSWDLARGNAAENNLILIKGTEITRNTPPGHFNALFTGDVSGYIDERGDDLDAEAIEKAVEQNAFIFWNHPGWKASTIEGSYEWIDFVDQVKRSGNLHGIEVFNGFGFHKKALDWAVEHNLTVLGNSDIHNLVAHDYRLGAEVHRTMTLVFARERSPESVREALEAGRTVAWASKYLAGKEENLNRLVDACIEIGPRFHSNGKTNYYEIKNNSDLYFELELTEGKGTGKITLYPNSAQILFAGEGQQDITYEVVNAFIGSDRHLKTTFSLLSK